MDAFATWKQEVDAEQDRLERTGQQLSEAEQLRRIDMYWVSVVRDIKPDDPNAFRKIETIRAFAGKPDDEYPLTYAALRSLPPLDNAPSIPRMNREMIEAEDEMRTRRPPAPRAEILDMLDSKLTNYISDLRKDDPKYRFKWIYFHPFLESGDFPNAVATFERKGHGKIDISQPANQQQGGRRTRRNRRRRGRGRGGNPPKTEVSNPAWNLTKPKPATVVVSNPIASLPRPPKPNPAAGTGLFAGRHRKTRRHRRR
jgi:hypothetical protein